MTRVIKHIMFSLKFHQHEKEKSSNRYHVAQLHLHTIKSLATCINPLKKHNKLYRLVISKNKQHCLIKDYTRYNMDGLDLS